VITIKPSRKMDSSLSFGDFASPVTPAPHTNYVEFQSKGFTPPTASLSPGKGIAEMGLRAAASANAWGNIAGSVIGGVAQLGSSAVTAFSNQALQRNQMAFDQKQIDRAYNTAQSVGLVSPDQMGEGMGRLTGSTFTASPRSTFSNTWN